ncbi:MAG: hypothetical protein CXR30_08820 [Geobacter sp.]|nr:MAG: hypothetical protein CXR30_08820 [Geobacter sp.]
MSNSKNRCGFQPSARASRKPALKDALNISFPSASAALAKFEEMGVLVQRQPHGRNRCFYAKEVIQLLDRSPG